MHKTDVSVTIYSNKLRKIKWRNEKRKSSYKKQLYPIIKKKEKNYIIETKFDKNGNKVSMYETVEEVDEKTITKENSTLLKWDKTT